MNIARSELLSTLNGDLDVVELCNVTITCKNLSLFDVKGITHCLLQGHEIQYLPNI